MILILLILILIILQFVCIAKFNTKEKFMTATLRPDGLEIQADSENCNYLAELQGSSDGCLSLSKTEFDKKCGK